VEERRKYRSIILFGMPGSGKGTQGAVLGQLPGFVHFSMADMFHKLPRTGKFGREIERYTAQALPIPDDLVVRIFERQLNIIEMQELLLPEQHILILGGLPRTCAQAERLADFIDVLQVFHLEIVNMTRAMERLKARALRESRLDEMSDEVIRRKLRTYHEEASKTLTCYPSELIFEVDADRYMIDVLCDIANRLAVILP
jgi:adenylate kinase